MQPDSETDTSSPLFVEPTQEAPPGAPHADPDAPWGINPDTNRPYTKSPEERAAWGEKMAAAREAARSAGKSSRKAPPKRRTSSARPRTAKPASTALTAEQKYAMAVAGLLSLPAAGLAIAGRILHSETLSLDSMTLALHTPDIAEAVGNVAPDTPIIAAALDKVGEIGPWGAVLMAVVPLGLQIAANHGYIKPSAAMGILSPDELLQRMADMEPAA